MAEVKHTLEQVVEAIRGSSGIKILVAKKLGVHRNSVENYLKRWPTARAAYDEEVESVGDVAESVIVRSLQNSDLETAKWYAMTKLKDRGYVRREEVKHQGDEDKPVVVKHIAAAQIRAAELAFLSTLGLKSGGVGDDPGHDHPPDAREDGVSPLPVPGGLPDGSELAPTRGQGAADRV